MIWDVHTAEAPEEVFRRAAEAELVALCPELADRPEWLSSVVEVFAELCGHWYSSWQVPADHYGVLLAQVLWAMNQRAGAEAALHKWCSADVVRLCNPGVSGGMSQAQGRLALCRVGLVRSGPWAFMGGEYGWILDLARIRQDNSSALELTACMLLRRLIHELAPVWDASSGEGWLGLNGIGHLCGICGRTERVKRRAQDDLLRFSESVLCHDAARRGWTHVPSVKKLAI